MTDRDQETPHVTLTIDGREVSVSPGTTILEAARILDIHIPTLCWVEGLEPTSSCFLCTVEIQGRERLLPACSLPAEEGMVVATGSDEVRASRKMALELLLSDHAGDCVAPCAARCPADLDIAAFIYEAAAGKLDRSMEILHRRLALPGSLGRICPRLCEAGCRRGEHDEGLAVGALHRYVADRQKGDVKDPSLPLSGPSVGIVGAGPAGLSAAFYLLRKGHPCTLYEANDHAGGMLRYGIPEYRLPREALDDEIAAIIRLGARFRFGLRWGTDFELQELLGEHGAVFLAVGAQLAVGLGCPGEELALSGIEFLHQVAIGKPPDLGPRVVVVGGGNTAMDAARTARRLGSRVKVLYRRTRDEMPCLLQEVDDAEEEGVTITYLAAPSSLQRGSDGALHLICQRMELGEPDASGRRRPLPIESSTYEIECDQVIAAIGQRVDLTLATRENLATTAWGVATDEHTLATSIPRVFAGGDAVLGADLAVRAVAAGRMAAVSIHQLLQGKEPVGPERSFNISMKFVDEEERAELLRDIERTPRALMPTIGIEERLTSFDEVELGLPDEAVKDEARRCLSCGCAKADGCLVRSYATEYQADPSRFLGERRRFEADRTHPEVIYEPGKCIACEACVQVAASGDEDVGLAIVGRGFQVAAGVPFDGPLSQALTITARRCAQACPTGALSLRSHRSCDLGGDESSPSPGQATLHQIGGAK